MTTTKERILVTLTPDMSRALKAIAKRERMPKATVASLLIRYELALMARNRKEGHGDLKA